MYPTFLHASNSHSYNETATLPVPSHEETTVYALNGFETFSKPVGYTCNASAGFRQDEYPTCHVLDPDGCQVLKEIVYLNSTPEEIPTTVDLDSCNVNGFADASVKYTHQVSSDASDALCTSTYGHFCPECSETTGCECQMYLHRLLYHTNLISLAELKCQVCGKKLTRVSAFKSHLSIHLLRSDQACIRCQAQVPNASLQESGDNMVPISTHQYRCRLCGTVNSSLTQLRIHYKQNHPKRDSIDVSDQPSKSQDFPNSEPNRRTCKAKASNFIKKIATSFKHGKRTPPSFAENLVSTNPIDDIDISQYVKKVPVTKKKHNFMCTFCSRKFSSSTRTKYHVFSHLGMKPFSCPLCPKRFTQKGTLETHMAIHNTPKGLPCSYCEKRFNFKQNLDVHVSRHHKVMSTLEAPARIKLGSRSFIVAYRRLSKSVLSMFCLFLSMFPLYTGRQYPCRFCFMTFRSSSMRLFHETVHFKTSKSQKFYVNRLKKSIIYQHNVKDGADFGAFPIESEDEEILQPNFASLNKVPLKFHHRRCLLPDGVVYRRHRKKLDCISQLIISSQLLSHCPWCSLLLSSSGQAKFHFVTHFLADGFICEKCGHRFANGLVCIRHMRVKHLTKRPKLRVLIRCDIPHSLQKRIGLIRLIGVAPANLTTDSNIPAELLPLTEAPQIQPLGAFTEQIGPEIVWLAEPQSGVSQVTPLVSTIPSEVSQEQQVLPADQSFVLGPNVQSGDIFLLPQSSLDTYYTDHVGFVDSTTAAFETDYQPTVDFVPSTLDFNSAEVTIATDSQMPFQTQESLLGLSDFFGCYQCSARFNCSLALSNHVASHHTGPHYYNVCFNCGWSRFDSGESGPCQACGHATFQQLECLMENEGLIGFARFYCTHCNLAFTELDQLETHVAELTDTIYIQAQSVAEEVITVEKIQQLQNSQSSPQQPTQATHQNGRRRPALLKKQHFQLSDEELDKIIQNQPTAESILSERLLYEAACERHFRSYPTGKRGTSTSANLNSSKDRPHVCGVCAFRFQRSSDLHRHMLLHTGVRPYNCKFCEKRFILPRRLLTHARSHHGEEGADWAIGFLSGRPRSRKCLRTARSGDSLTCHLCGAIFSSVASLHVHMRIHTGTKTYACPRCNLSFRTPIQRKRHLKKCQKSHQTNLDATGPSFDLTPYHVDLQQSSQRVQQPQTSPSIGFKGLMNDRSYALPPEKYVRLESEQGTSSTSFISLWQCRKCQKTFGSNKAFANHQCAILHQLDIGRTRGVAKRPPFTCSICNHRFTRRNDLRRHERTHESNEIQRRPFSCGACGARFAQSGSLNIHLRATGHDEITAPKRRFRCRFCGGVFFYRSGLVRHLVSIHGYTNKENNN